MFFRRKNENDEDDESSGSVVFGTAKFASLLTVNKHNLTSGVGVPLGGWRKVPLGLWRDTNARIKKYKQTGEPTTLTWLHYSGDRHLVTIAPSRSGKGTMSIIPTLLEYDASMLVIDPKGQNAAVTARRRREMGHEVYIVNPFNLHGLGSALFNPLATLDLNAHDFVANVGSLCEALIFTEGKDPHWPDSARDLIAALIMHVLTREGEIPTLGRVRQLLTLPPDDFKVLVADMTVSAYAPLAQKAGRFLAATNEIQSIVSTAITQTSFLDDPAIVASMNGDDFRFIDLKRRQVTVFLVLPSYLLKAYNRWLRLIVVSALAALTSTPERAPLPVLLLLDEFFSLGYLAAIENAMALAAGYGVQLWTIFQDLNQLKDMYGGRWETFLANAGLLQVTSPNDMTTVNYFSERCGKRTAAILNESFQSGSGSTTSTSRSYSEIGIPLYSTEELFNLDPRGALIFLSNLHDPVFAQRWPYYEIPAYAGRYDPDPYHPPPPVPIEEMVGPSEPAPEEKPLLDVIAASLQATKEGLVAAKDDFLAKKDELLAKKEEMLTKKDELLSQYKEKSEKAFGKFKKFLE